MRSRVWILLLVMCVLWGIGQAVAQDDPNAKAGAAATDFAARAARQANPALRKPSATQYQILPPTTNNALGCDLAAGVGTAIGEEVVPYRIELTYPDGVYVVHATAGGSYTQLCDPKFGDMVTGPQYEFVTMSYSIRRPIPTPAPNNGGSGGGPVAPGVPTVDPNLPTATPTRTPLPTATQFLGTPLPQENVCSAGFSGAQRPRLKVGFQTASVVDGRINNRVRSEPNTNGAILTEATPGTVLDKVITGPACGEGYVWWLVEVNGVQGWTAESSEDQYFLEPQAGITATPPPSPTIDPNLPTATPTIYGGTPLAPEYMCQPGLPGLLPPRLVIGEQTARVVPGGPDSRLRSQPNSGTTLLGQVPESTVLDVLAGPACGPKSDVWWLVEVDGIQAWTAESRGTTYYVEPMPGFEPTVAPTATPTLDPSLPSPTPIPPTATPTLFLGTPLPQEAICPPDFAGYTQPRLKVGIQTASVVAGRTNNRVRSEPNTNGTVLTEAVPETVFDRVLAGPACGEGYVWWLVEVNGVQGWTAESSPDGYFLEALLGITATPSPAPSPTLTLLAVTPSATFTPSITPTLFLGTPLAQDFVCPTEFTEYMEPRLIVGSQTARILEGGSGNRLRAEPGTNGMQIGRAEPGQVLDRVLAGPACAEGYVWWLVEANGITSWTAESDGEDYYIEPLITATPVASPTLTPAG